MPNSKEDLNRETLLDLSSILPYPKNNRTHPKKQIETIAKSIKQFGFNQPIVIDEKNIIIIGHGRFEAASFLKMKKVPCIKLINLSEEEKRAYRILDNKLQNDSDWQLDNLQDEFNWLTANEFNLEEWTLDDLFKFFPKEEIDFNEDSFQTQETDAEHAIQLGDVIKLNKHTVTCADATEFWYTDLQTVLLITDPPYGVNYDPAWRKEAGVNKNEKKLGKVANDDKADWREVWQSINAQVAYVWHASSKTEIVLDSLRAANYLEVSQIIWNKDRFTLGRGDYHFKHEPCWYMVKKGKKHNWQGARDQSTVWDIKARDDDGWGHGTQKPIECMLRPILNNTKEGDIIADPFLGSGTTLIAAEKSKRVLYATELEPKYCSIIIERYKDYCLKNGIKCQITINDSPYCDL